MDPSVFDRLYRDVRFLTTLIPYRNYENVKSLNKAAAYIHNEFSSAGGKTEFQIVKADGREYKNVVARFGPEKGEKLIVGAHYDVAGDQPGADDNASGIAGLLEISRMLGHKSLTRSIELVAYTLEEPPFFATDKMGSAVHANSILLSGAKVRAMICLDMIGYFSEQPGSQKYPNQYYEAHYPDKGNFIAVVGIAGQESILNEIADIMRRSSDIEVIPVAFPGPEGLPGLSDHRNYWKLGYQAVMINDTAFLRNFNYHQKTDIIDTLNFPKMAQVVKGVFNVLINL